MAVFLFKKMDKIRKIPTEREMIDQLRRGAVALPPLSFRYLEDQPDIGNRRFDALVEASWEKRIIKFVVECKSLSRLKAFQDRLNLLKNHPFLTTIGPYCSLPFLSDRQLQWPSPVQVHTRLPLMFIINEHSLRVNNMFTNFSCSFLVNIV